MWRIGTFLAVWGGSPSINPLPHPQKPREKNPLYFPPFENSPTPSVLDVILALLMPLANVTRLSQPGRIKIADRQQGESGVGVVVVTGRHAGSIPAGMSDCQLVSHVPIWQ